LKLKLNKNRIAAASMLPLTSNASAPGKLILFGEHAVVHGRTALAGALSDLRVFVRCELCNSGALSLSIPVPEEGNGGAVDEVSDPIVPSDGEVSWSLQQICDTLTGSVLNNDNNNNNVDKSKEGDSISTTESARFSFPSVRRPDASLLSLLEKLAASTGLKGDAQKAVAPALFLAVGIFSKHIFGSQSEKEGEIDVKRLPGLRVAVTHATLPVAAGLGSSAAVSVAISAALLDLFVRFNEAEQFSEPYSSSSSSSSINRTAVVSRRGRGQREKGVGSFRPSNELLDEINAWAFGSEMLFHGNPSGLDNSVATFGGAIAYSRQLSTTPNGPVAVSLNAVQDMPPFRILVCNTHAPKETSKLVAGVKLLKDQLPNVVEPLLSAIHAISIEALNAIASNAPPIKEEVSGAGAQDIQNEGLSKAITVSPPLFTTIHRLVNMNHAILNALGVGHPSLDAVISASERRGFASKLTGAGGGGCAFVLLPPQELDSSREESVSSLINELQDTLGYTCFETKVGGFGVLLHE
jgi:mevalonate kinase